MLLPPQPLLLAGTAAMLGRHDHAMRNCRTAPFTFALGPNAVTTGVPTAAAICIGAESTQMNRRADAINAASSVQRQLARRDRRSAPWSRLDRVDERPLGRVGRDPVITSGQPSPPADAIEERAVDFAGQHLKSQRDPGWTMTKSSRSQLVRLQQPSNARLRVSAGDHAPAPCPHRSARRRCAAARRDWFRWYAAAPRFGNEIAVGKASSPEPRSLEALGTDRVLRTDEAREPGAAAVLGEVHDEVVAPASEASRQSRARRRSRRNVPRALQARDRSCARGEIAGCVSSIWAVSR